MRQRLLELALQAVKGASGLDGVSRIALIGSLTSGKHDPKDVDLLVTVMDNADLAPLAVIGRRLQGKAQAMGKGGEIFLCSDEGEYLGRICPWRECRPGIRQRCRAWHCGQRPHLYDDFGDLRLDPAVIAFPRIVVWPEVRVGGRVPEDVEAILLVPLREIHSSQLR